MQRFFLLLSLLTCSLFSFGQDFKKQRWIDSVFSKLKTEEKIGQLFIVPVSTAKLGSSSSKNTSEQIEAISALIQKNKIGGIYIESTSPVSYARMVNKFQSQTKIPLFIGANIAKDLSLTFDSTMDFYEPIVRNAIENDSLINEYYEEVARQSKILGIHLNLDRSKVQIAGLKFYEIPVSQLNSLNSKKSELMTEIFVSGFDLFRLPFEKIDPTIKLLSKSLKKNKLLASRVDSISRKILALKYDMGLPKTKFINTDNLVQRLNTPEAKLLKQKLAEQSVTVVRNHFNLIPIQRIDDKIFTLVSNGDGSPDFLKALSKYADVTPYRRSITKDTISFEASLPKNSVLLVGLFFHVDSLFAKEIKKISKTHEVIVCSFINPLELKYFKDIPTIIAAYQSPGEITLAAAEIIFGGLGAKGKLPVTISDSLQAGKCIKTQPLNRLSYELPEAAGMDSHVLEKIEPIAREAISIGATPGCQVLVAKNGKVVYEKSFGTLSYHDKNDVTNETIYDLASVTKVSATLQTVMHMHEKGLIDVNKKASVYLSELKGSNKEDFIIKDILTHQAGLWPYLPFWSETVKDSTVFNKYYRHTPSEDFPYPVAENMFSSKAMKDSLWQWIIHAKIREKPVRSVYDYRYSDMGFYIMQHLAEKMLGQPMEDFLQKNIYRPLGASSTGYLPLRKFPASQIAPTEHDTLFRKSLLVGYVHDQGAAMHGGIAGHAGLFSKANDMAKLGQMWLNKGSYGGVQFFKPETIDLFTSKQYETSRRGLGWDKPVLNSSASPTSIYASAKTFGHTGFTGTCIWVDPEFNLIYIFLSNRVNPDMNNNKILNANIRPRIQDVIYQSIFEYSKTKRTSCN